MDAEYEDCVRTDVRQRLGKVLEFDLVCERSPLVKTDVEHELHQ